MRNPQTRPGARIALCLTPEGQSFLEGLAAQRERPRPYTGPFPIPTHRTLAQIDAVKER